MRNLAPFAIGSIVKKLNRITVQVNSKHSRPFPKPECFWLSRYTYQRRYIKIHSDGRIAGGLSRFVTSLVDFSFVRSIVAHKYALTGVAYDPVSLFLLELFRHLEKYTTLKDFINVVHDRERGKHFRLYAGINTTHLPCEGTFTNLKDRLGESLYNQIFHVLVEIADLLGFLSYKIIATDGTLFPTNARYKGCTYFCEQCNAIQFQGIIENVKQRVHRRLATPESIIPGKEIRIKAPCPSPNFPEDVPRPKVEVLALSLEQADPEKPATKTAGKPSIWNQIFGLKEELKKAGLDKDDRLLPDVPVQVRWARHSGPVSGTRYTCPGSPWPTPFPPPPPHPLLGLFTHFWLTRCNFLTFTPPGWR
ncbi:MAG: hypothetical protein R6T90_07690 [Dissulfuribacterales bacterium]